jgi:hypothetical protein
VVEFEPLGPDDEDQASTESDAINYVVMELNNGYYELQQAIRDALLLRNGLIKVYVDERTDTTTDSYEGLTDLELQQVRQPEDPNLEIDILKHEEREDGLHDIRARVTKTTRDLKVQAVDITHFGWYLNHDSIYLDDCPFCFERSYPSRSDLIEMGYPKNKVQDLNSTTIDTNVDATARNQDDMESGHHASERSQERIEFYECYMRVDRDGDGIAELLKICIGDRTVLEVEPAEFIPYASGTPFIQPHRFNGLGLFDKLRNIQDSKTHVLRQMLDNQNHANNARVIVQTGQVDMDDVTNSRPGGVIRVRGPGAVEPFPFTDIGGSCQATLDYLDKVRSERGGASLDLQSAELQLAGETAHGVERQMSSKEQLAGMMTRTLAETLVRSTFLLVHKAMRLYFPDVINIRARGQFAEVDPAQWPERDRVNVRAGLSTAERARKKQTLESIMASNAAKKQLGEYVSPVSSHNLELDWGRASGLDNPERYFTDPASEEAQQAQQAQAAQAQQAQEQQQQLVQLQAMIEQQKHEIEQAKIHQDQYETRHRSRKRS